MRTDRFNFAKVTYISKDGKQTSWSLPNLHVNMQTGDNLFIKTSEGFEQKLTAKTECRVNLSVVKSGNHADYKIDNITQQQKTRYVSRDGKQYSTKELTLSEALI